MTGKRWLFYQEDIGARRNILVAEATAELSETHAKLLAHLLADDIRRPVLMRRPGSRTDIRPNPTLVHHGWITTASHHVLEDRPGDQVPLPLADFYALRDTCAQRAARAIATALRRRVILLSNKNRPREIHQHRELNPGVGLPSPGEVWRSWDGTRYRITAASRVSVSATNLDTGNRDSFATTEFLARFKPPAGRPVNPRRRNPDGVAAEVERLRAELDAVEAAEWTAQGYKHARDPVTVKERRDFYALDIGTSGAFLVRKADGAVFGIKGYGTPDYRKGIGFAPQLTGAELVTWRWRRGPFRTDMRHPATNPGRRSPNPGRRIPKSLYLERGSLWDRIDYPKHIARVVSADRARGAMPPMVNLEIVSASGREVYGTSRLPVNEFLAKYEPRMPNPRVKGGVGEYRQVTMTKREVQDFKARWPASGLPDHAIAFVFASNGDLVGLNLSQREHENAEGSGALSALAQDAWAAAASGRRANPGRRNPADAGYFHGGTLAADGWVEMTRAQWAKIHRDYKGYAEDWTDFGKTYGAGTPSVMGRAPGQGTALYPVRIVDAPRLGRRAPRRSANPKGRNPETREEILARHARLLEAAERERRAGKPELANAFVRAAHSLEAKLQRLGTNPKRRGRASSGRNPAPVCYGQVVFRDHVQEWYESASRHAGARARELRRAGYRVVVSPMGSQVTPVGRVNMTLLTAYGDMETLPPVRVEHTENRRVRRPRGRNPLPRWADPRSIRTVTRGRTRIRVACPRGHWHPRGRRGQQCDVGTRGFEKLTPAARNPRGLSTEFEQAQRTSAMWHEFPASHATRMKGPDRIIPHTLVGLGKVRRLDYDSNKYTGKMQTYTHKTHRPYPVLATDPRGRHLYLVGGKMRVTADGLVH